MPWLPDTPHDTNLPRRRRAQTCVALQLLFRIIINPKILNSDWDESS